MTRIKNLTALGLAFACASQAFGCAPEGEGEDATAPQEQTDDLESDDGVETAEGVQALQAGGRPLFQLPFACEEVWWLKTYPRHDDYDIDMTPETGAALNRPILASYAGTVVSAGWDDGGGNYVRLDHGNGWNTLYLHMVAKPVVRQGDRVKQGQVLGKVGSTGDSSGPHLHYEQNLNRKKVESWFNGSPSGITDDGTSAPRKVRSRNCGSDRKIDPVGVYGVLSTGQLYYAVVDPARGQRTHTVTSTAKIGFVPKAMAALNHNTILVTSPEGHLHRIDVSTNKNSLVFTRTAQPVETGWTHDLLTFDGAYLYGIADGVLSRYAVSRAKPGDAQIGSRQEIGRGWTLKTFTATGPKWLLAISNTGALLSYRVTGPAPDGVKRYELKAERWGSINALVSGGDGYYLGRANDSSLGQYTDTHPFDGKGADVTIGKDVDAKGWTQKLISAVPNFND
ncbi:MAG: M23 family metallopeptidase [Polyangiales bacterium]